MATSLPGRRIKGVTDQADFDLGLCPSSDIGALSDDGRWEYLSRKAEVEMRIAATADEAIKRASGIDLK